MFPYALADLVWNTSTTSAMEIFYTVVNQNPHSGTPDTCGSSSGSAISVAANMVAVSLGTETDGSIICPADYNSVVRIKPTVGLTS